MSKKKVIIIGAGILGAATAFELTKRNIEVTIIEQEAKGRATSAAAGIICPWITKRRNQDWYTLAKNGAAYYKTLIHELGASEMGYKQVGAMYLDTHVEKLEELQEIANKRRVEAPEIGEIKILNKKETKTRFPLLKEDYFALYVSGAARVDGRALRDALLHAASAPIIHGQAGLIVENKKVRGVTTEEGNYFADEVIATNGVWMNELLDQLETNLHFQAQKGEIVHLQVNNIKTDDLPVIKPPNNQYLLSFQDGHIVVGATHEHVKNFSTGFSAGGMHYILNEALQVAPGLKSSEIIETRVGFRPFTHNHLPVFGRLPGYQGLFIANGLGASGLTTGPFIGKLLTQLVSGEKTTVDVIPYQVENNFKPQK